MQMTVTELFERHSLTVFLYFRRMVRQRDLAQDLTQEVFLRVVQALPGYDERGRVLGWLLAIARNVLLDHQARPERAHLSLGDADPAAPDASHVAAFSFYEALALVPRSEREAFLLHELAGFSYTEIAGLCGLSEHGVRSKVYRARRQIRHLLAGRLSGGRPEPRERDP